MDSRNLLRRVETQWKLRSRNLSVGRRTLVMGVVNITPDSFSDGGLFLNPQKAVSHALRLLEEGADILDLGAESTRPGSHAGNPDDASVSADEEQARLLPVLEGVLKAHPEAIISVDTYKSETARASVSAGAELVNDVSGFTWDRRMAKCCAELGCGVVLTHTRGKPDEWRDQQQIQPDGVLPMVREGLADSLGIATDAGIAKDKVVLDPGYGFGKRFEQNYELLARQSALMVLGRPILVGLSRKSFLSRTLSNTSGFSQRIGDTRSSLETASIAAMVAAILEGASVVRVHAVPAAVEAAAIADALLAGR